MKLQDRYFNELKQSKIIPNKPTNSILNAEIEKDILNSLKVEGNVLFQGFISNEWDYCAVTRVSAQKVRFYFMPYALSDLVSITDVTLKDSKDKYKKYYVISIKNLPIRLQRIIRLHNNNTQHDSITAHRVVASLKYNCSQLEIHHLHRTPYNYDGTRLEQSMDINELLPISHDLHYSIHSWLVNDCETKQEVHELENEVIGLKTALDIFVIGDTSHSRLPYKNDSKILKAILIDVKTQPITIVAKQYGINFITLDKIVKEYKGILHWIH